MKQVKGVPGGILQDQEEVRQAVEVLRDNLQDQEEVKQVKGVPGGILQDQEQVRQAEGVP